MPDTIPFLDPDQIQALAALSSHVLRFSPAAWFYAMILIAHRAGWPWLAELAYVGLILAASWH